MHSAAIAPIRGLRDVLGALTLGRSEQPDAFTTADLTLLEDITRRAGLALDNARLYQRQRKVAETMQRYLLPQLPHVPGLETTSRYLPAPDASHVGGDWYDAFSLGDGDTALVIGDVSGHDLDAAAGMAQLRNVLRSYAWSSRHESPGRVVERVDRAVLRITDVSMATLVLAVLGTDEEGRWTLSWTNAATRRRCWSLARAWPGTSRTAAGCCWAPAPTGRAPTDRRSCRPAPPSSSTRTG